MALARSLMLAVFNAGHAPFAPHLLYSQVLTESPQHLKLAFAANFAFLDVCEEIWVWGRSIPDCSSGMRAEVEHCVAGRRTLIRFMPEPFVKVARELRNSDGFGEFGKCSNCDTVWFLGTSGRCLDCFSGVSRR